MSEKGINIAYSCSLCGLNRIEVEVRYRESTEDVVAWMKNIVEPALCADHNKRSPFCNPDSLQNILIPTPPGTDFFGGPVTQ